MAAFRLALILAALLAFFVVGIPVQRLLAWCRPAATHRPLAIVCRWLLVLAKVRVVVEGDWPRHRPILIVPNHVSWIDIPALSALAPFCFLAKREIATWPVVSTIVSVQGTIFIDRRRRRSIPAANRGMAVRMLEGRPVLLFPEGTTVAGPPPGRFHSSHFAAARDLLKVATTEGSVTIQPVAITYSRADAAWIGDDALLPHLWRLLRRPPLTCHIRFCTPLVFARGADRKVVARATRDSVVAALLHDAALLRDLATVREASSLSTPAANVVGQRV